jgi:hypothetical protein
MSDLLLQESGEAESIGHIDNEADTLAELWKRRASLTGGDMSRIYAHVRRALRGYFPSELRALGDDKEELIAQFIYLRVLHLGSEPATPRDTSQGAPFSGYAICAYFRRYLIDCLRSASHRRSVSLEVEGVSAELDTHASAPHDPIQAVLADYDLDEARARAAARAFVRALPDSDRIILAGSLGSHRITITRASSA